MAIRTAYPECVAEDMIKQLADLPSPSIAQLSRWRLRLDCSFMLWQRARHKLLLQPGAPQVHLFGLCDASPQGGREFFVSELHTVTTEGSLDDFSKLFLTSVQYQSGLASAWSEGSDWHTLTPAARLRASDTWASTRSDIRKCVEVSCAPPVGLGHRRCDVIHKLHALTHQLFLLFSSERLASATRALVSFTTDFGVEANLARSRAMPLELLMPWASDVQFEESGAEGPDVAGADMITDEVDYSSSLQVSGALHILHNLSSTVLSSLDSFPQVKPGMIFFILYTIYYY